jgi:hypothetical protein
MTTLKEEMMMEEAIASAELAGANMTKKTDKWEEEFDKQFGEEFYIVNQGIVLSNREQYKENDIKQFISSILEQEKIKMLEAIDEIGEMTLTGNSIKVKCPECKNPDVIAKDEDMPVKQTWIFTRIRNLIASKQLNNN